MSFIEEGGRKHLFVLFFHTESTFWGQSSQNGTEDQCVALEIYFLQSFCPALTKLALDLHVNFCVFVCLSVCLSVCLFVFPVFFSRRLIGSYTGF